MVNASGVSRVRTQAVVAVRLTKPGGRIVMGNWIPNDPTSFLSQLLKISASFMPPPPEGFISPMTWGVESQIVERFGQAGVPKEKMFPWDYSYVLRLMDGRWLIDVKKTLRYGKTFKALL